MKISQSQVRVEPFKAAPLTEKISANKIAMPNIKPSGPITSKPASSPKTPPQVKKPITGRAPSVRPITEGHTSSNETVTSLERIRSIAQQELELIRRMRSEAVKYQRETAIKARSEAHQLVLRTRLATQREVEDMIHIANKEIQKVLADIRVIRITAQEELAAQRKFTDAAKLNSMSKSMQEIFKHSTEKALKKKKLATAKS